MYLLSCNTIQPIYYFITILPIYYFITILHYLIHFTNFNNGPGYDLKLPKN